MTSSASAVSSEFGISTAARISLGTAVYNELLEFLHDEAALLDHQRFEDWTELLAEDLAYTAPLRQTRAGPGRYSNIIQAIGHFDDDYLSIMSRVGRLGTKSAWAEDPPSRTRRLVTNVRIWATANPDEYEVVSYLLLSRSRYEESDLQILTAERRDLIRRVKPGFKIARREIIVDQSVLGMQNLAVFL
ncbi:MAG: aromatic-ring-hydroxylating dioxygenase subunit beta [Verrucomicrobiaceae bacterium]|nr:aromatic-ring-hydroxylating dioxygenase subunit beta [Verrucomicrobiaceae bacterium]